MARLFRPAIPVEIRCRVALRQLDEKNIDSVIDANRPRRDAGYMVGVVGLPGRSHGRLLIELCERLAEKFDCRVEDLRLDHDPPLGARPQERRGLSRKTYYVPDANDPDHLFYRPHGTQFAGSHDVKTRIRGDHGQYSDVVLIKRERRRQKRSVEATRPEGTPRVKSQKPKFKRPWPKRPFPECQGFQKRKNP